MFLWDNSHALFAVFLASCFELEQNWNGNCNETEGGEEQYSSFLQVKTLQTNDGLILCRILPLLFIYLIICFKDTWLWTNLISEEPSSCK